MNDGTPVLPSDSELAAMASNPVAVTKWRTRLADLGWFMKALKEPIAR